MRAPEAARVGLVVLVAAVLLGVATFALRGTLGGAKSYTLRVSFPDAQGIQKGAYVRVRGVEMGAVEGIRLGPGGDAILTLRILDEYQVKPEDSIRIAGGLLGFSPAYVEITPGGRKTPAVISTPGVLPGESGPSTDRLLAQSDELLRNLNDVASQMAGLTKSMRQVTEDPVLRRNLARTTTNFAKLSDAGVVIAGNMQSATAKADRLIGSFSGTAARLDGTLRRADALLGTFQGTATQSQALMKDTRALVGDTREVVRSSSDLVKNTNTTVQNASGLVTETRGALGENREKLKVLFDNLNGSLKQLDATLAETRSFIGDPTLRADFKATAENVKEATANLNKISQDVRGLTGDPKVQEDLRATIAGLRDATEEAAETMRRVRAVLGGSGKAAKSIRQRLSETEVDATLVHGVESDRTRLDFSATIPWSDRTFYRLGLYDVGESNRFIGQMGQQVRPGLWARGGFYAGKLGLGLDVGNVRRPPFSADLYGLDRPRLDLRGNIPLNSYLDLTLGLDNVFRRPDPVLGVRYRR